MDASQPRKYGADATVFLDGEGVARVRPSWRAADAANRWARRNGAPVPYPDIDEYPPEQ